MEVLDSGATQQEGESRDTENVETSGTTTVDSREYRAEELKEKGNAYFSAKQLQEAAWTYDQALRVLDDCGASPKTVALATNLRTNRALCYLNMRNFQQAKIEACRALEIDPLSVKGNLLLPEAFRLML